jgi:diguanylate cyclase (GGDEF)-like protein
MEARFNTFRRLVLGPDWSLKAEHAAAFDIAAHLRSDWVARSVVVLALTVLSLWIVHPAIALAWCFLVFQNEWMERRFAFQQRLDAPFGKRQIVLLILQRTSGTLLWVFAGLVFIAEGPNHRLLGLSLLIGVMVHVSLLYNTSRIQTLTTGIPCLAGFLAGTVITLFDPELTPYHKVVAIFAIVAILAYMITATVQNLNIRERLRNLVSEKTRLAAEDPLTGLQNRRSFVELVATLKSAGQPLTLAFIDLDRFKPLNDQYGHAVGDQVLREIGRRLIEQPDMLGAARLGGDEFAALFAAPADAHPADRQMLALHNCLTAPIHSASGDVSVGASIGWVRAEGENTSVSEVLHSADVAMRRAKVEHLGVVEFDPVTDQAALASSAIEIAFRHALARGRIRAALQPIVSVSSGRIVTMELLARWPDSGFPRDPAPQDFIPIAERLGLLNDMLWSTLHQALPALAGTNWSLAINVSPSQLTSRHFLQKLGGVIAQHAITPQRIELEITEQVAFRDVAENCAVLDQARSLGFRVVLDDFGAGYSSLAMLDRLPLDKIKLDRAFVGELRDRAVTQKILRATMSLAHDLGISCTVEGIECAETAALVASFGCDQMQGYWVGMPELVETRRPMLELAS